MQWCVVQCHGEDARGPQCVLAVSECLARVCFMLQKALFDDKLKTKDVYEAVRCLHAAKHDGVFLHTLREEEACVSPFATSDLGVVMKRMTPFRSTPSAPFADDMMC